MDERSRNPGILFAESEVRPFPQFHKRTLPTALALPQAICDRKSLITTAPHLEAFLSLHRHTLVTSGRSPSALAGMDSRWTCDQLRSSTPAFPINSRTRTPKDRLDVIVGFV